MKAPTEIDGHLITLYGQAGGAHGAPAHHALEAEKLVLAFVVEVEAEDGLQSAFIFETVEVFGIVHQLQLGYGGGSGPTQCASPEQASGFKVRENSERSPGIVLGKWCVQLVALMNDKEWARYVGIQAYHFFNYVNLLKVYFYRNLFFFTPQERVYN